MSYPRKPFIVAEISANHLGSLDRALAIVEAAAQAGADAIKLQTWSQGRMCLDENYTITWNGSERKLVDIYREAYTPWEWHSVIFDYANSMGITAFSTPFDKESVDFLETLKCPIYKISSFEIIDLSLIKRVASTGKPMIISTGMANFWEIQDAVIAVNSGRSKINSLSNLTLLHCISNYPAEAKQYHLYNLIDMVKRFECDIGLSDHTLGLELAVKATELGASVIEKHLTLSRSDGGLDASFSMEPEEFKLMVTECKRSKNLLGNLYYGPTAEEPTYLRRSLYCSKDIAAGDVITNDNVCTARPALGIAPKYLELILYRKVNCALKRGMPVTHDVICNTFKSDPSTIDHGEEIKLIDNNVSEACQVLKEHTKK